MQKVSEKVNGAFDASFEKIVSDPDGENMSAALAFYTTSEGGFSLNPKLQKQKPDDLTTVEKLALHYISLAFKKTVKAPENFYIYRGVRLNPGQDLKSHLEREENYSFFSASTDINVAKNFAGRVGEKGESYLLRILITPDVSNVIPMENFSVFKGEREILINRGALFESADYNGFINEDGMRVVDFEYIGSRRPPPVKVKILDENKRLQLLGDKLVVVDVTSV